VQVKIELQPRPKFDIFPMKQGMIALRREATMVTHEDFMDAIVEVQAKKKANLNYYA
jgi:ATP-dependent 26S proteasome regulatory subunit